MRSTQHLMFSIILLFFQGIAKANDPGITDTEIVFGQSAAFKGPSGELGTDLWLGANAFFEKINRNGGVHGRKIVIKAIDDSYDPDKTQRATITLIRDEKVFGLFGYVGTPTIVKALPVVQKFSSEGMFLFSNFTGAQPQREPPHDKYVFNIRTSYRQETAGIVENLLKIGYKRIAVFIQNDAYGRSGADGIKRALELSGLSIVAEATYERGALVTESMTKQVEIVMKAKADAIILIGAYGGCAAFIRDARNANFIGPIANVSFVGPSALLKKLKDFANETKKDFTKNLINSQVVPPFEDTTVPLVAEFQHAMAKIRPKLPENLRDSEYQPSNSSFASLEGYLNAKILVEVLKRVPRAKLSRRSFIEAIESTKNVDVGLVETITFSPTKHQALDFVYFTTIHDGKYVSIADWSEFK